MGERADIVVRPYDPQTDYPFVSASWTRSYEETPQARSLGGHYLSRWTAVVDDLLARSTTLLAVAPDDRRVLLGFICGEPGVVHYAFVKRRFRRFGVAQALGEALLGAPSAFIYTHQTSASREYALRHAGVLYDCTRIWLPSISPHATHHPGARHADPDTHALAAAG